MGTHHTFFNNGHVRAATVVSDPDQDGYVKVHAAEGDSDAVKEFTAKANPDPNESGGADLVQA